MSAYLCGCDTEAAYNPLTGRYVGNVCDIHRERARDALLKDGLKGATVFNPDPKLKDSNPKEAIGSNKIPLHLWPETASVLGALGLLDGTLKYGRSNFRAAGVKASVYYDAARRHLSRWFEGQDNDPDSGLPHLAHVLACIAIIVDAQAAGSLTDDRMYPGGFQHLIDDMTCHVSRLKELYKDKNPRHFTKESM